LLRKLGGRFDTTGWELNNGFRNQDYPGSAQSMLNDHGIWVMSPQGEIFSGRQVGAAVPGGKAVDMHHSAFLAGAAIRGGGEWLVQDGTLKVITGSSGHYTPNFAQFQQALQTLAGAGIDLGLVAAEWCYRNEDDFYYFNAKQLAQSGVKADWLGWPKFGKD